MNREKTYNIGGVTLKIQCYGDTSDCFVRISSDPKNDFKSDGYIPPSEIGSLWIREDGYLLVSGMLSASLFLSNETADELIYFILEKMLKNDEQPKICVDLVESIKCYQENYE